MINFFTSFFNMAAMPDLGSSCSGSWACVTFNSLWAKFVAVVSMVPFAWFERAIGAIALLVIPAFWIMRHMRWTKRVVVHLYGDMEDAAFDKFALLSLIFGFLIAAYWAMRGFKDTLFTDLVGFKEWQPIAKMLSLVVVFGSGLIFSKIVYWFRRHKLFHVVSFFFGTIFLACAFLYRLNLPEMTMFPFNLIPGRAIGWIYYLAVESMGSILIPSVFWAFIASTSTTKLAKMGFPLVYLGAQCGSFLQATFFKYYIKDIGMFAAMVLATVPLFIVPFLIDYLVWVTPAHLMVTDHGSEEKVSSKTGMFEGLRLIFSNWYLLGVTAIATLYEVVATILEYQFKGMVGTVYRGEDFASYMAGYNQALAFLSMLFLIFGTTFFVKRFGVSFCLIGFPLACIACIGATSMYPQLSVFLVAVVAIKGLSYTLNSPLKEFLYLPTSKDVKFKAKGFIDGFGSRLSKAAGSSLNKSVQIISKSGTGFFLANAGAFASLGVVGIWLVAAVYTGIKYNELTEKNQIIQ